MVIGIEDNVEDAIRNNQKNLKGILERGYVLTGQVPFGEYFYRRDNSMIVYNYERDEIVSEYELKGYKIFENTGVNNLHKDKEGKFYLSGIDLKLDKDGLAGLINKGDLTLEIPKEVIEYFQNMSKNLS